MKDFPNWLGQESSLHLNPKLPQALREKLQSNYKRAALPPAHVVLASTGSTGTPKLIALSKEAFLASADAANAHLQSTSRDVWCLALPLYHVGGLSIGARAHLSGAKVVSFGEEWNADSFVAFLTHFEVSLCSMVPTQIFDLIQKRIKAPASLRAIVVGGARLSPDLYKTARLLGWPLLPSFGMTECCSQVATASLESLGHQDTLYPELELLSHLQARTDSSARLSLRGPSLLSGYISDDGGFWDPKDTESWFETQDFVHLDMHQSATLLEPLGRGVEFVKVFGENVNLKRQSEILREILVKMGMNASAEAALVMALDDARAGSKLVIVSEALSPKLSEDVFQAYNAHVAPFERALMALVLPRFPRSQGMGKILRAELKIEVEKLLALEAQRE